MKKVFSVIALSALAGTLMLTSCKKDEDNGPSYADGWNKETVDAAVDGCVQSEMGNEEECSCYYEKVAQNIGMSEMQNPDSSSDIAEEAAGYHEECFGEE